MMGGGMGFGGFGFGSIFMLLFWIVVAVAVFYLIKSVVDRTSGAASEGSPEEILKRRLARGEITSDEYEDQLRLLKKS
jgi:putative membrane protein